MIPPIHPFVKHFLEENHKLSTNFSVISQKNQNLSIAYTCPPLTDFCLAYSKRQGSSLPLAV
jgi:hypothetical protein